MKVRLLLPLLSVMLFYCENPKDEKPTKSTKSADEIEILKTVNKVYNNIVVDKDKSPDFEVIKEQFVDGSHLGFLRNDSLVLIAPDDYFNNMETMLSQNEVGYLKEWEIQGETKYFGNIAQRTSLYGVHFNTQDSLSEKGIINFQLARIHNEWKIVSMIWQAEKENLKVPETYFNP